MLDCNCPNVSNTECRDINVEKGGEWVGFKAFVTSIISKAHHGAEYTNVKGQVRSRKLNSQMPKSCRAYGPRPRDGSICVASFPSFCFRNISPNIVCICALVLCGDKGCHALGLTVWLRPCDPRCQPSVPSHLVTPNVVSPGEPPPPPFFK